MGQLPKGDRFAITCRVPTYAREHLQRRARELGVPLGEFVGNSVLLAEGMDVSTEALRVTPNLIRLYPQDRWEEVIERQPPDVAERIRRALGEEPNGQLQMTA